MSITQAQYYANVKSIHDAIIAAGETPLFAAAMIAQSDAESSNDPKAIGDHGEAWGLWQWHIDRVVAIRHGCGIDIHLLPPVADQVKAMLWEMHHVEKSAYAKINACKTSYDAGMTACTAYERAGAPGQAVKRGNRAAFWAAYFMQQHGG
jgi:hypothetical protein